MYHCLCMVTWPEPSTHDVAYVTMDRGGAKAVGFNRSGGFSVNTVSKSGTDEFHGNIEYKAQPKSFVATPVGEESYEMDKSWLTASLGGPLIEDTLYFIPHIIALKKHALIKARPTVMLKTMKVFVMNTLVN